MGVIQEKATPHTRWFIQKIEVPPGLKFSIAKLIKIGFNISNV